MKRLLLAGLLFGVSTITAQRYDIKVGKLENLKGISAFNVTFDYKGMAVSDYGLEEKLPAGKIRT